MDIELVQDQDFSNFTGTPAADNKLVERLKTYQRMLREGKTSGGNVTPFSVTLSVQNTDTSATLQYYLNPSLLAGIGDDGVPKAGSTFKSIEGTDKLKLVSFSGNLNTFLRWLQHKPAVATEVKVVSTEDIGISAGSIVQWEVSPNLSAGYIQKEPLPFSQYNTSTAYSSKKAEITDKVFFFDNENGVVVTIPAACTLTITLNLLAYNSIEYALFYRQRIGQ